MQKRPLQVKKHWLSVHRTLRGRTHQHKRRHFPLTSLKLAQLTCFLTAVAILAAVVSATVKESTSANSFCLDTPGCYSGVLRVGRVKVKKLFHVSTPKDLDPQNIVQMEVYHTLRWCSSRKTGGRLREPPPFTCFFMKISFKIAIDFHFSVFSWEGEYSCDTVSLSMCLFWLM